MGVAVSFALIGCGRPWTAKLSDYAYFFTSKTYHKMKKLFPLLLLLAACSKNNNPPATPNTPNPINPNGAIAKFIPNWYNNDTLIAIVLDSLNHAKGYDTIITKTANDTSYIIYKNKQYYIWREPFVSTDTMLPNQKQYSNIYISPTTNKAQAISKSGLNTAVPYKYKDQQGNWSYQAQGMMINDQNTSFPKTSMGYYMSYTLHK